MNTDTVPRASSLRTFKPNAQDERYIRDGLAMLGMTAPFWRSHLYGGMSIKFSYDVPIAATDSYSIFVNPDGMRKHNMGPDELCFVDAHEVLHKLLMDLLQSVWWRRTMTIPISLTETLPYDHSLMNAAMDYRINAMLIDGKIGKMPKVGLYDKTISEKGYESCVEIYAKLWKQGKRGTDFEGGGMDIHLAPTDEQVAAEATPAEKLKRVQAMAAALQAHEASGQGKLPGALSVLVQDIMEPKVDWQDHLRATMLRHAGTPGLDWTKMNKRLISRPEKISFARRSHYGCGTVVIGIDTSGSVFSKTTEFLSEAAGIVADLNPERVVLIWCDADIGRIDDLDSPEDLMSVKANIDEYGLVGGGGTDFRPVFDHIELEGIEPDMLVYLTDTYGYFPSEPDYPVIWGSIIENPKVPFGQVVEIVE